MPGVMLSHSKLQLEVLKLYREFLKASRGSETAQELVKLTFRANSKISPTNFLQIEYLIRSGRRKLKVVKSSEGITYIG